MKKGPIDLSIVHRSTASTNWVTANGVISPDTLDQVKEQSSDNASALNSLPTPFARFFVAREAFRRVAEAKSANDANPNSTKKNKAGYAYEQLVSDCLDIYEILFNLKYHRNIWNGTEDIEIVEWDATKDLKSLNDSMPKLYNALNNYYKTDIKEDILFFVIYNDGKSKYLLGCSTPFTGWVTPPDIDKKLIGKNRTPVFNANYYDKVKITRKKCGGFYFDGEKLFEDRDEEFKNYMYNNLFAGGNVDSRLAYITSYIKSFQHDPDISQAFKINLKDNKSNNNNPVIVNGIGMQQNDEIDINSFFQPTLLRLPYKLCTKNFKSIDYEGDSPEDYDFLIPLNAQGLSLLNYGATCSCKIRNYDIEVKLSYNGKDYKKFYEDNPNDNTKGKIKYLDKEKKYINIGLFPNILSTNEKENNYFKVALFERDYDENFHTLKIDKCSLKFFKQTGSSYTELEEIERNGSANSGVYKPKVRSRQSDKNPSGSMYYEIYNSDFDAIEITVEGVSGMIIPVWRHAKQTSDSYTYAIDLGTSNTFISRTKNGQNNAPVQLEMSSIMTSFMNDYKSGASYSESHYIEQSIPEEVRNTMVTEFTPAIIDGKQYDFPIRTALCQVKGSAEDPALFDNTNIAFFYEKLLHSELQDILTDIKWVDNKNRLSVFVRELMLIIKADILQQNGMLGETNIVRFRPLSFDGKIKKINEDIWSTIPAEVFGVNPKRIDCFTESEAPYYYFTQSNITKNTDSVTVIDIGGGSTDFVYFKENKPLIASSVHFGCDELWGEGHNKFENARENGIFKKYQTSLIFNDETISGINSAMIVRQDVSAKNIINFWLANQKLCKITDNLRDEYAPLFVYHFTALVYYIASLYKYKNLDAPRTVVFSGNGSLYVDNFITKDKDVIQEMIKLIFDKVYGKPCDEIFVTLPSDRKESTCYGGLYKNNNIQVPEVIYHGIEKEYKTAKELINDKNIWDTLSDKYKEMNDIYKKLISLLKNRNVIDRTFVVAPFTDIVDLNYKDNFTTHFLSEVKEKYLSDDDICNDSIFFIPVIDKLFELTKVI